MNEKFIVDRITQLRMEKGVSEYQLSYDLGRSRSYFNNISRGENLLSMSAFLELCDYFKYLKLNDKNRKAVNEVIDAYLAKQALEEQKKAPKNK